MADPKVKPLYFKSYLAVIKNSVGANTYRNFYAEVLGEEKDILGDGDLSCAFFVCSILFPFKLISDMHTTVAGTVRDLEASGFEKVEKPKAGDVIVWSPQMTDSGKEHAHIGFYIGDNQAVSNRDTDKTPQVHPFDYREIEAIYRSQKLDGNS